MACAVCSARGLVLRTGSKDAHSGVTGGAARNPLAELMDIVHACVDAKTGKVKIPGFYDDVVEPSKAEIKSFLQSGFQVSKFKQAYGFKTLRTPRSGRGHASYLGRPDI
jgi:predicted amidohydrolase